MGSQFPETGSRRQFGAGILVGQASCIRGFESRPVQNLGGNDDERGFTETVGLCGTVRTACDGDSMRNADFQAILEYCFDEEKKLIGVKADDYASNGDRLANFKSGASFTGLSPRKTLWGYLAKHLSSVKEIVDGKTVSRAILREKIGDARNYLLLLEALVLEEMNRP